MKTKSDPKEYAGRMAKQSETALEHFAGAVDAMNSLNDLAEIDPEACKSLLEDSRLIPLYHYQGRE